MSADFAATHVVPDGGLWAWADPDPHQGAVAQLDPGLEIRVLDQRADGWAHMQCSNGWSAWVDGRLLRDLPPPGGSPALDEVTPAATDRPAEPPAPDRPIPWMPTHRTPSSGVPAWATPDQAQPPVATMDPDLEVQLLEQHADGWAHVQCSNGWNAWVDGHRLESQAASPPPLPPAPTAPAPTAAPPSGGSSPLSSPLSIALCGVGAVLVVASIFLNWTDITYGGRSFTANSREVAVNFLWDKETNSEDPSLIVALFPTAALLVAGMLHKVRWLALIGGIIVILVAGLYTYQTASLLDLLPGAPGVFDSIGIAPWVAFVGGILGMIGALLPRRAAHS